MKLTPEQQTAASNGHYFGVPRVVIVERQF